MAGRRGASRDRDPEREGARRGAARVRLLAPGRRPTRGACVEGRRSRRGGALLRSAREGGPRSRRRVREDVPGVRSARRSQEGRVRVRRRATARRSDRRGLRPIRPGRPGATGAARREGDRRAERGAQAHEERSGGRAGGGRSRVPGRGSDVERRAARRMHLDLGGSGTGRSEVDHLPLGARRLGREGGRRPQAREEARAAGVAPESMEAMERATQAREAGQRRRTGLVVATIALLFAAMALAGGAALRRRAAPASA